jgi:hypothetical protein
MRGLRLLGVISILCGASFAANTAFIGTWKLNKEKSTFSQGTEPKEVTITFEAVGNKVKRVASGIDADGKPINENSTIAWDGTDQKFDESGATVAVKLVDDHTIEITVKSEGKTINTGQVVVSSDGKTATAKGKGVDEKGRKFDNTEIYEKQ